VLRLLLTAKAQFYLSLGMLLGAVVGWPLSALTWARDRRKEGRADVAAMDLDAVGAAVVRHVRLALALGARYA
jgi:hypothetical protein